MGRRSGESNSTERRTTSYEDMVAGIKSDLESAGTKIIKLSPEESKEWVTAYRDIQWEESYKKYPDAAEKMQSLITDPDFYRFK